MLNFGGVPNDLAGQTTFSPDSSAPETSESPWGTSLVSLPGSLDDILVTHIPKGWFFLYSFVSPGFQIMAVIFWGYESVEILPSFREFAVNLESFIFLIFQRNVMNRSAYIRLYRHVDTYIFYDRPYVYIIHIIYTMLLGQKFHPQTQSQLSNAGNLPKAHADWMGLSLASSKEEARCEKPGAEIRRILCSQTESI